MACGTCSAIQDAPETGEPYIVRSCDECGRKYRVRERGKHGIGIVVKKGDEFVLPAGTIQISANPLKGGGQLSKTGLTWFAEMAFSSDLDKWQGEPSLPLVEVLEVYTDELRKSELLKGIDLDDESQSKVLFDAVSADKYRSEWFVYLAAYYGAMAQHAIAENNAAKAAWAMACSERFRSVWIFKENFEEVVWMGHSAKRLTDVLNLWKANQQNNDEEFWQIKLLEAPYVLSQIFSAPVTFVQDKAYVGGQQIDGKSARFVDLLFSGDGSGEAILIEIKTPVTQLLNKTKYRTNLHAPTSDLSGAVVQAADYRANIISGLEAINSNQTVKLTAFNPRVIVIVGNTTELDTEEKRRSFDLYRSTLTNIDVITFDELFRKMEHLARIFNLVKTSS